MNVRDPVSHLFKKETGSIYYFAYTNILHFGQWFLN